MKKWFKPTPSPPKPAAAPDPTAKPPPVSPPTPPPPPMVPAADLQLALKNNKRLVTALTSAQTKLSQQAEVIVDGTAENRDLRRQLKDAQTTLATLKRQVILIPEKYLHKPINWDDLHVYITKLPRKIHFTDCPEIEFDRIALCCRREFEKEFHFMDMQLYLDDDDIDIIGQAASCWFARIGWTPDSIPLLLVTYTERDIEGFMDVVIDANAVKSLRERILERMYLFMLDAFRKFQDQIDKANYIAAKDRDAYELLLRQFKERLALLDTKTEETLNELDNSQKKKISLPWWGTVLLGAGWVAAFVMAFFVR